MLLVSRVEAEEVADELPLGHKGEGEVLALDTQHEQASLRLH
jgi:hypothetical protein